MCRISVVTVTFNAENVIAATIESVLAQRYSNYEYIIIDGKSEDKTFDIAKSYKNKFLNAGISYHIFCEKDTGIYDAMNKGINKSIGKWIIFLNAGDRFADSLVLKDVFLNFDYSEDILYGDVIESRDGFYRVRKVSSVDTITDHMPFSHQSTFVKREIMSQYKFDTSYRIAGDYNLFMHLYKDNKTFHHVDRVISVFDLTGISNRNQSVARAEDGRIRTSLGIQLKIHKVLNDRVYEKWIIFRRNIIIKYFPSIYYSKKRGWSRDLSTLLDSLYKEEQSI